MKIRVSEKAPLVLPLDAQDFLNQSQPMRDLAFPPLHRSPGVQAIVPKRFVWHVDRTSSLETRTSIQRFGLLAAFSAYDRVFANNQSESLESFFPFVLYGMDETLPFTGEHRAPVVDIWRIDTSLCSARWYIDPNMHDERRGPVSWYICTRANIPPAALRRYRVLPTWEQRCQVQWGVGVASIVGSRMQLAPYPFRKEEVLPIIERAA